MNSYSIAPLTSGLFSRILAVLLETHLDEKLSQTALLARDCAAGRLVRENDTRPVLVVADPGRPAKPELVPAQQVPHRPMHTLEGRAAMLHAIAHIEFCAINLALDAAYRFRQLPEDYTSGWIKVAAEEAEHFSLIRQRLQAIGYDYGDFAAHGGLWALAVRTADDALARMALVPRLMEARGLDATPPILAKFAQIGDHDTVAALQVILDDEVGHVALGDRWFRYLCGARGLLPEPTYRQLLLDYRAQKLKKPLNVEARLRAGFSEHELARLSADC